MSTRALPDATPRARPVGAALAGTGGSPADGCASFTDACAWARTMPSTELVSARVALDDLDPALAIDLAEGDAVFASPFGATFAGFGSAAQITARGADRFRDVSARGGRLLSGIPVHGGARPRLIGGFSFEADDAAEPWTAFGQASFRLPRFLVDPAAEGGSPSVTITAEACVFEHGDALRSELRERAHGTRADSTSAPREGAVDRSSAPPEGDAHYEALVERALVAIDAGLLQKVVLARRERVVTPAGRRPGGSVRTAMLEPHVTVFAFRAGDHVFLSGTPEMLVSARGARVRTEAVAGSRPRGGDDRAELAELVASDKDAREHALVRAEIARALAPLVSDARIGGRATRTLAFVHHLVTPIEARRAPGVHVLDVAAALHPTPAMAGCPTDAARAYIRAEEGFARGWYASPVGWFDASGDGDLVVGIRSGVLDPQGAWVFAGAGIVRGSTPAHEAAETRAKQASVLRSFTLGARSIDEAGVGAAP